MRFSILLLFTAPLALMQLDSIVVYAASVSSVRSFTTTIRAASSSSPRSSPVSSVQSFTTTIRAASSTITSLASSVRSSTTTVRAVSSTSVKASSTLRTIVSSSLRANSVSSVRPSVASHRATSSSAKPSPAVGSTSSFRTSITSTSSSTRLSTSANLAPSYSSASGALPSQSSASTPIAGNAPNAGSGICGGSSNGCWPGGFSIENDTEITWPDTGRTVEYELTITNTTCMAAGYEKPCILINNQFPGPTIEANWGDNVRVVVTNQLQDNGTSMHWHGIRQFLTNDQDGVNGITECPIPPGQSKTYEWKATSYGTTWYHSHYAAQYGDGVLGPLVINGPTTAGYDIDMGPIAISETYRLQQAPMGGATTVDEIITNQGPLIDIPDNILFNGKNVNAEGGGERLQMTMEPGKRHLMRFINVGVDNFYKVGLDNHMMQVVAIDLQPVQPYYTQYVSLGIGQRFDAIVTANQTIGNYYLRALPMSCVNNKNNGTGTQNAIISYRGANAALPTSTAAPVIDNCFDEPAEKTIPFVAKSVDISTFDPRHLPIASPTQVTEGNNRVFRWQLGTTTQSSNWESPLLQRLVQGNDTITPADNVVFINEPTTAFWYIQNNFYEPHPVHLHGNDVRILATGDGQWDEDVSKLESTNPMRRDTFMVRAGGYIILALETNNPGVWLMHCHIAWHVSEGLSTALYVRKDDIKFPVAVTKDINDGCAAWNQFRALNGTTYERKGSGL